MKISDYDLYEGPWAQSMEDRAKEGRKFLRESQIPVLKAYRECMRVLGWVPLPLAVYRAYLKRGQIAVLEWKMKESMKAQNARITRNLKKDW